jgi:hypothetical protein
MPARRRSRSGQPDARSPETHTSQLAEEPGDAHGVGTPRVRDDVAMSRLPLTGGCNCGAVRFEVSAPLVAASYCHCRRCQRRSGAGASPNAHPAPGTFRIVTGEDRLRVWKPDGGGEKWFCGTCGSSLFGRNPSHADPIGIRMGTFDDDPGIRPSVRQFVTYAAPWEPIPDDGLPRHAESRHGIG